MSHPVRAKWPLRGIPTAHRGSCPCYRFACPGALCLITVPMACILNRLDGKSSEHHGSDQCSVTSLGSVRTSMYFLASSDTHPHHPGVPAGGSGPDCIRPRYYGRIIDGARRGYRGETGQGGYWTIQSNLGARFVNQLRMRYQGHVSAASHLVAACGSGSCR